MNTANGIARVLLYYLSPQRLISWLVIFGLVCLLVAVVSPHFNTTFAFGMAVWAYVLALLCPAIAIPFVFRSLISNRSLSLVPHFHVGAGVAALIFGVLLAIYLPLASRWLGVADVQFSIGARIFVGFSLYVGFWQWVLPSRYMYAWIMATMVLALMLAEWQPIPMQWLLDPRSTYAAFAVCVIGWLVALSVLAGTRGFRPAFQLSFAADVVALDLGWSRRVAIGPGGSPAGTLLEGFPSGPLDRLMRALGITVLTPLASVLFLYLIGFGDKDGESAGNQLLSIFLLFIFFNVSISTLGYGEWVGRARLLWLRHGGDRASLWQLLERRLLTNIGLFAIIAGIIAIPVRIITGQPEALIFLSMMIVISIYNAYFGLITRLRQWASFVQGVIIVLSYIALILSVAISTKRGDYTVLASLEIAFLVLAFGYRHFARAAFSVVDWYLVKPAGRGRKHTG